LRTRFSRKEDGRALEMEQKAMIRYYRYFQKMAAPMFFM